MKKVMPFAGAFLAMVLVSCQVPIDSSFGDSLKGLVSPSTPTATPGIAQVTLKWNPVSRASSYNVYWSTNAGLTTSNGTKVKGASSPWTHTGLTAGTKYYYRVTAVSGSSESAASSVVAATPLAAAAPAAPVVSATPGVGRITLSWAAVAGAASYNLYWSTSSAPTKASGTQIAGVTSPYIHSGLTAGTAYSYVLTAVNVYGESVESAVVTATTTSPPAAPAPSASGAAGQVTVTWAPASGAASYNLYWSTSPALTTANGTKVTGVTSPYTHTGRAAGTTYYYLVSAVNAAGETASPVVNAATTAVPSAPAATATAGAGQATVSWSPVSGATSYNLYWSTSSALTTANGTKVTGVTSPYAHTGLSGGTTYYYLVTGVNAAGESAASPVVSAVPTASSTPASVTFGNYQDFSGTYANIASVANPPAAGFVYSVWTRSRAQDRRTPADYPNEWWATAFENEIWHHVNMYVGTLWSPKWNLRMLTANSDAAYTDASKTATRARYNSNTELTADNTTVGGVYIQDYSYFESGFGAFSGYEFDGTNYNETGQTYGPLTVDQITDWVWMAWQAIPKADGSGVTLHQWVKFGLAGPVIPVTQPASWNVGTYMDFTAIKAVVAGRGDSSWVPTTEFTKLTVGNAESPSYLYKARIDAASTVPSLTQLNSIATGASPASAAWAAWNLSWTNQGPDFSDASGHGRDLVPDATSRFVAGVTAPY